MKKKDRWHGPPRRKLKNTFETWARHLFSGIDDDKAGKKIKARVVVQRDGGYQNDFLFAERLPTTESVWTKLEKENEANRSNTEDSQEP